MNDVVAQERIFEKVPIPRSKRTSRRLAYTPGQVIPADRAVALNVKADGTQGDVPLVENDGAVVPLAADAQVEAPTTTAAKAQAPTKKAAAKKAAAKKTAAPMKKATGKKAAAKKAG